MAPWAAGVSIASSSGRRSCSEDIMVWILLLCVLADRQSFFYYCCAIMSLGAARQIHMYLYSGLRAAPARPPKAKRKISIRYGY